MCPEKYQIVKLIVVFVVFQLVAIGCGSNVNYKNDSGVLATSEWMHNFGYVKIGDTEAVTLTISNCGTKDLLIQQTGLAKAGGSGNNPGSDSTKFGDFEIIEMLDHRYEPADIVQLPLTDPISLKTDQELSLTVEFTSTSIIASYGCLEITHDGINKNPAIVEFFSIPTPSDINVRQDTEYIPSDTGKYSFGKVDIGSSSQSIEFTIENFGMGKLQISLPVLASGDISEFSLDTSLTGTGIPTNSSTTFEITFSPKTDGEKSAIVSIGNDDPDENPYTFTVCGNRTPYAPAVYSAKANPDAVSANGSDEVVFSAHVEDKNGIEDLVSVTIDLTTIEGNLTQQLFDDGSNSDDIADDGIFSCKFTMPNNPALYGVHELTVTATDSDGLTGTGVAYLSVASGSVIHVDDLLGDDSTGDGSANKPYKTIQFGIDKAKAGDLVWVHGGIYKGDGNRDLDFGGKKIIVFGNPSDPAAVTIDCEGTSTDPHRGYYFHNAETTETILTGFKIKNGYADYGGGIRCDQSSPSIEMCLIMNCFATSCGGGIFLTRSDPNIYRCICIENESRANDGEKGGGGLYMNYGNSTVKKCMFIKNNAFRGAGIFIKNNAEPIIENCVISSNNASLNGGGISCRLGSKPVFKNCLIDNNVSEPGTQGGAAGIMTINPVTHPVFDNCNIINNIAAGSGGGMTVHNDSSIDLTDCIIWGNEAPDGKAFATTDTSGKITLKNCCFDKSTNWLEGPTNKIDETDCIYNDPLFVEGARGVYYLEKNGVGDGKTDSPCIDAGSANTNTFSYLTGTTTYVDNSEDAGVVDMGYHYPAYSIREIYVDAELGDNKTGDGSESKPYKTIQKGIDVAGEGDIVWVESGTYRGDGNRDLDMHGKAVRVKGKTGDPDDVIIDCEGSANDPHRGFYFHSGETLASQIHSLTITNGFAPIINCNAIPADLLNKSCGGAIITCYASPKIDNCNFRSNIAKYAGGGIVCIGESPVLLNSSITNNIAENWHAGGILFFDTVLACVINTEVLNNTSDDDGAGIRIGSSSSINYTPSAILENCKIGENKCRRSTGDGAGLSIGVGIGGLDNKVVVRNCLITLNKANQQGGALDIRDSRVLISECTIVSNIASIGGGVNTDFSSIVELKNSISWGNTDNGGNNGLYVNSRSGEVTVTYCDIDNVDGSLSKINSGSGFNPGTNGNITDDPVFAKGMNGNYYLDQGSSLCVNGGSGQATDYAFLDGRTTSINGESDTGIVDMGYHYLKEAQGPYAIGWIGGGSDGWQTTPGTSPNLDYKSFNEPTSVVIDTAGNIYVCDYGNNRICKWDKSGNALGWIGDDKDGWNKLDVKPASSSNLKCFDSPFSVCIDKDGNLYIADTNNFRVCKWDKDGIAKGWIGGGYDGWQQSNIKLASSSDFKHFYCPAEVYVDSDGNIFVSENTNNRVSKWNKDGVAQGWIGGGLDGWNNSSNSTYGVSLKHFGSNGPYGLFTDSQEFIYVVDHFNNRVCKWDKNGTAFGWIGGGHSGWQTTDVLSTGYDTGKSDFNAMNNPYGVFVNTKGNIFIADRNNNRVCKWNSAGISLGWIGGDSNGWQFGSGSQSSNGLHSFNWNTDVAVDSEGNIYIVDQKNHRVCKWKDE